MNKRQEILLEMIKGNPGIRFRDMMRLSGMKNGVLSHHLNTLESAGRIRVKRYPRWTSYSSLDITDGQLLVAKALKRHTSRSILLTLVAQDGLRFGDIVECCRKAPSTISLYLKGLVRDGLVRTGPNRTYNINCRDDLDVLLDYCTPSPIDKPVSGLEDIIGSL